MQIKTRMAIVKKKKIKFWQGCGEKETLIHCWWECKLVQPLCKTVWRFLKTLKIELPCDSAILVLGIYLKKIKMLIQKDTCTPMFIAALFTIAKIWKQHKCLSRHEWIKRGDIYTHTLTHTYTHNGIKHRHRKNEN